ncbi:MAG TPA: hypothetical protein VH619_08125 [Verrucomicrobiae bacterium]|nr:hypothetical protein [Verrucomicrobiae bacterium]
MAVRIKNGTPLRGGKSTFPFVCGTGRGRFDFSGLVGEIAHRLALILAESRDLTTKSGPFQALLVKFRRQMHTFSDFL